MKTKQIGIIIPVLIVIIIGVIVVLSRPRPILKDGDNISTFYVRYNSKNMENVDDAKISEVLSKYKCKFAFFNSFSGYLMDDYPIDFCTDYIDPQTDRYIEGESLHIKIGKEDTVCILSNSNWVYYIIDADKLQSELEEILDKATPMEEDSTPSTPSDLN